MIEIRYTTPRSVSRSRRSLARAKRALLTADDESKPKGAPADLQRTAAALVQQYPLASMGVAAGAAFMFVRVKWLREAAMTLLASHLRQQTSASLQPPHD